MISVTQNKRNEFKIIVKSEVETVHFVTVDNEWYDNLTKGRLSKEELVEMSKLWTVEQEEFFKKMLRQGAFRFKINNVKFQIQIKNEKI